MKRSKLILSIVVLIILLAGSLLFGGLAFLRGVVGLLFVLFLPGWAIVSVFFSGREFGFPERIALTIGFSIAVSILTGLALHLTPWGLQTGNWILLLAGVTLVAGFEAWKKRRSALRFPDSRPTRIQPFQIGLIALALLIASVSIAIARRPTPAAGFEGYTSIWIHPIRIEEGYAIQVGVSSMEFDTTSYSLELGQDERLIDEYENITLEPGESTQFFAQVDLGQLSESPVEARLFRLDDPGEPYRQVTWWPGTVQE